MCDNTNMCSLVILILVVFLAITCTTSQTIRKSYVCPKGFNSIGKNCYHFGNEEVTWINARFQCEALNSSLLILNSLKEQSLLKGLVIQDNNNSITPSEKWIDAIYDWRQKQWKWGLNGNYVKQNYFTKVNKGDKFRWNCIVLDSAQDNKWVARRCTERKSYICKTQTNVFVEFKLYNKRRKKFNITRCTSRLPLDSYEKRRCMKLLGESNDEPSEFMKRNSTKPHQKRNKYDWICPSHMISLGNRCYLFSTKQATWKNAFYECKNNGSKLAIIRNRRQDKNLRMFANQFIERQDRWIGGIYNWKTAEWIWAVTGKPIVYKGFNNQMMQNRTYHNLVWHGIFMDPAYDNQWNAADLTEMKKFICQVPAKSVKKVGKRKTKHSDATITILKNKK